MNDFILSIMNLRKCFLVVVFGFTAVLFSCCNWDSSNYSKDNHLKTTKIKDSLYNEIYLIRSIGSGTERYSEYITDSVNFRKYICTHDFGEWLYGEILKNDALAVYKVTGNLVSNGRGTQTVFDTILIDTYNINELKREGKFE